jgi:amino acid transporter
LKAWFLYLDYYHAALDSVNRLPGTAALAEPNTNGEWQMATGTTGSVTGTVTGEGGVPPTEQLRSNALGLAGLVILGVAYMGLALTVYFNVGLMEGITGPIVPLAFAAVAVAMLPTAASFAVMNSRRPSTGSVFTWLWETTAPSFGVWLGWVLVVTYIVGSILQPVMFGLFFNSLLNYAHIGAGTVTAVCAGVLSVIVVGVLTKKDVRISARVTGYFIAFEAGFVALLATFIIIKQAVEGNFTLTPFNPGAGIGGWSGFQNAILFAVLAIAAFDIVAPMAEETRTPRSLVPKATILVTLGAGLYWVFTSFAYVIAVPAHTMAGYVSSGQFTPIYLVADKYIGFLRLLVPLTGMTAVFAAFTAISITASRLLYALSRERLAPRRFAEVDRHKTPWNAQALVLGCCLVLPILIVIWQDGKPLNAFAWIGVAYVFFVLIPYTLVCVANIMYHLRIERDKFNPITNLVLPLIGIVINCYIFYKNFLLTYLINATDFTTQSSIAYIGIAVLILLVGVTVWGVSRAGGVKALHRFSEVDAEAPA